MSKITIQIDPVKFDHKPMPQETAAIRGRLKTLDLALDEIAKEIEQGKTICPAVLSGKTADDFIKQQLFLTDIDNEIGKILYPQDAIKIYTDNGLPPAFWYPTFSSTPEHPKYRIGFASSEVITSKEQRDAIQERLISLLPQADKACKDAARIFFGTDKKVVIL